jgi:hypothetical protein
MAVSAEANIIDTALPWTIPISLLVLHFIGDFLLQSNWMALNKSKSWRALLAHCAVYSACFLPFGLAFAGITFLGHVLTDAVTSRITSKLWFFEQAAGGVNEWHYIPGGKRHWFFVTIGADQLIHYAALTATYAWLIGG